MSVAIVSFLMACPEQESESKLRIDLNAYLQSVNFNGSVLYAQGGEVLLSKGYGMANFEHDVPNTPRTKFRIGSMSKQFTAMASLQLYHQKRQSALHEGALAT